MESGQKVYAVSELTELVKGLLEDSFPSITVEGEISNCKPAASGHLYFNLKDAGAMIQAVMFRFRTRGLSFEPADGALVRAKGSLTVYVARGQYQLLVERMEKAGIGDLLAMLEDRKRRLAAEGLFDNDRKKPLPRYPTRIAVITSATGAALRDIFNVIRRRNPGLGIVVLPSAVQGEDAPSQLVARLRQANRWKLGDVIILGRGGGSIEDLLAFSDEELVREVASSEIPVISAVGHEVDWALSDFAADLRAPTPSAAAELVSESRERIESEIAHLRAELETTIVSRLERSRLLLSRFEPDAAEAQFMKLLHPALRRFDEARDLLSEGIREAIESRRHRLEILSRELAATSPEAVLARGFAVVSRRSERKALRDSSALGIGDELAIRLAHGELEAKVTEVQT